MEHPDLAQIAAVVAAAGWRSCSWPGAGGWRCWAACVLVALAEVGLALGSRHQPARGPGDPRRGPRRGARHGAARRGGRAPRRSPALGTGGRAERGSVAPADRVRSAGAARSRWPRTVGSGVCCRCTSCSRPPLALAWRGPRSDAGAAAAATRGGAAGRRLLRVRFRVACLGGRHGGSGADLLVFFTLPFALLMDDRRALAAAGLGAARAWRHRRSRSRRSSRSGL